MDKKAAEQLVKDIAAGKWKGGIIDHHLNERAKEIVGK